MKAKLIGPFICLIAIIGCIGEYFQLELPTVRFPFNLAREVNFLNPWFGWFCMFLLFVFGGLMTAKFNSGLRFTPMTIRRIERFKSIRRGYLSLWIVIVLGAFASLDHLIVGNEALLVKYNGKNYFPALTRDSEKGEIFGLEGDEGQAPADYRKLKKQAEIDKDLSVIMPLIGYAPTGDTVPAISKPLNSESGILMKSGKPFSGLASKLYDINKPERKHLRFRYRNGIKDGPADGWDEEGARVYGAKYVEGKLVSGSESWNGAGNQKDFLAKKSSTVREVHYAPSPPSYEKDQRHFLGTNSRGYDVVAYLFGGLQVNFKAAIVYIPLVYILGVSIGLLMGFFAGWFDIILQRIIEILSNIPFLFVVMIASTAVPEKLKESAGLWMILFILLLFGWMGMTYLMRTSALKEKQRDYIAASRVIGASTPRILFRHLLPNSIAIVITLVPFSVSSLILSLTSLDYLGFGLPAKYATWGQLLRDGLENLAAPWLVTSAFMVLVGLLILITFIGEAVREAFDPKKFSYYR
tara:strand:- start:3823 stop:5394 length:1572 start_codon:yes stop_codon:yes gene_type:complete